MADGLLLNINDPTRRGAQQDLLLTMTNSSNYYTAIKAAFLLALRRSYDFNIIKRPICEAD